MGVALNIGRGAGMSTGREEKPTYEFGRFRLEPAERLLVQDGQIVPLTPKAFDLLVYLVERHGRLVAKSALMNALWPDTVVEEANVAYNVSALRKVLADSSEDAKFIETVPTRGYRFVAPVTVALTRPEGPSAIPSAPDRRFHGSLSAYRIGVGVTALALLVAVTVFFTRREATRNPNPVAVRENTLTPLTGNPVDRPLESARISPDGKYLAFSDPTGLQVRRIDGGATQSIPDTSGLDVFGWTPDSENVIAGMCTEGSCAAWDVPFTGSPRTATGATWSDNERVVINASADLLTISDTGEVTVTRLNGSTPQRVVGESGMKSTRAATLSVDGSRVFFTSNDGTRIESVSVQGGATSMLHTPPKGRTVLSVGPVLADGRLLFVTTRETFADPFAPSAAQAIWQIDTNQTAAKGDAEQVTDWRYENIEQVSASTDGKRIAFVSTQQQFDVYTAAFDPQTARLDTPTRLTRDDRNDMVSAWMPDNATVLFYSSRHGSSDLFSQRFDSDVATPVVAAPGNQYFARVTSDARWILFLDDGGPDHRIAITRSPLRGGIPEPLTPRINGIVHCSARGACVIASVEGKEAIVSSLDPLQGRGAELYRQDAYVPGASLSGDGSKWAFIVPGGHGNPQRIRIVPLDNGRASDIVVQKTGRSIASLEWLPTGGGFFSCDVTFGRSFTTGLLAQRSKLVFIAMNGQAKTVWAPANLVVGWAIASRDGRRVAINVASRRSNAWMISGP